GQKSLKWPHLNPEMAAEIAKKSKAKKLILTHFDANIYRSLKERKEAEKIAQKIFKKTISAFDDLKIDL
ncbi:MAG: ribonuclease Z, partial [Patescibacteria group bacterium]|nr:ribonuclease Z [Patescibacteria group bacterium]